MSITAPSFATTALVAHLADYIAREFPEALPARAGDIDPLDQFRVEASEKRRLVAALAQAQTTGRLSLALVGAEDDTIASAIEVNQRSLLGLGEIDAPVEKEKERVCTIRTRRGAEVVEIPIPCTN